MRLIPIVRKDVNWLKFKNRQAVAKHAQNLWILLGSRSKWGKIQIIYFWPKYRIFFFFWFVTFSTLVVRKTFWRYTTIIPLKLQINSSSSGGHRLIHEVKSLIPLVGIAVVNLKSSHVEPRYLAASLRDLFEKSTADEVSHILLR